MPWARSSGGMAVGCQPSPWRAALRMAARLVPPIISGMPSGRTGRGEKAMSENWKNLPSYRGSSSHQRVFHYLDGLVGVRAALGEWDAHGLNLGVNHADANAQGDAPAR